MAHGQKQLHSWQRRTVHRLDAQARHSKYSRLRLHTYHGYTPTVVGAAPRAGCAPDRGRGQSVASPRVVAACCDHLCLGAGGEGRGERAKPLGPSAPRAPEAGSRVRAEARGAELVAEVAEARGGGRSRGGGGPRLALGARWHARERERPRPAHLDAA